MTEKNLALIELSDFIIKLEEDKHYPDYHVYYEQYKKLILNDAISLINLINEKLAGIDGPPKVTHNTILIPCFISGREDIKQYILDSIIKEPLNNKAAIFFLVLTFIWSENEVSQSDALEIWRVIKITEKNKPIWYSALHCLSCVLSGSKFIRNNEVLKKEITAYLKDSRILLSKTDTHHKLINRSIIHATQTDEVRELIEYLSNHKNTDSAVLLSTSKNTLIAELKEWLRCYSEVNTYDPDVFIDIADTIRTTVSYYQEISSSLEEGIGSSTSESYNELTKWFVQLLNGREIESNKWWKFW